MPISIEKSYCLEPSNVTGTLQLSAPPNISDTLIRPLVTAFQRNDVHLSVRTKHVARGERQSP